MPKCINDETKTYKGDEPSPKGLGYSAGKLEPGHKQVGNDGNMWYVKTCNRWVKESMEDDKIYNVSSKSFKITKIKKGKNNVLMCDESDGNKNWIDFDFSRLPDDCYVYAYLPICEKMTEPETGLEEKFGGKLPYLHKNKPIPTDQDDKPFIFLCQFRDPRSDDDALYQMFISGDKIDFEIRKIKLNTDLINNQCKDMIESELEPYKIVGWKKIKELVTFEKLRDKFKFSQQVKKILWDQYFEHSLTPNQGIKVGGSPVTCQAVDYDEDLLQVTHQTILDLDWGNAGIGHFSEWNFVWDCF
jgi:hypothetical protein